MVRSRRARRTSARLDCSVSANLYCNRQRIASSTLATTFHLCHRLKFPARQVQHRHRRPRRHASPMSNRAQRHVDAFIATLPSSSLDTFVVVVKNIIQWSSLASRLDVTVANIAALRTEREGIGAATSVRVAAAVARSVTQEVTARVREWNAGGMGHANVGERRSWPRTGFLLSKGGWIDHGGYIAWQFLVEGCVRLGKYE